MSGTRLARAASELMAAQMQNYDVSHDMFHLERVQRLAEAIARDTGGVDMTVVTLGAVFHDLVDHKYAQQTGVSVDERLATVDAFLKAEVSAEQAQEVMQIVTSVGYTKERQLRAAGAWTAWHETSAAFHCVQDADRLDAMGAIGMMRCAAYSCAVNRPLYGTSNAANQHIDEKLLLLDATLRTRLGRRLGAKRHAFLLAFKQQLDEEAQMQS